MQSKLFKKGFVVGIIVLFIGVGIQPAMSNEVNIPRISDSEEDCFECQSDDRPICILLYKIWNNLEEFIISLYELADSFPDGSLGKDILETTAHMILVYGYARIKGIWAFTFNCEESVS